MTPQPITKKQFVSWLIVFSIGMAMWAAPGDLLWGIGLGVVAFGNLLLIPLHDRSLPVPRRDVVVVFVGLLVLAALMVASKRWLPDDLGLPVARFIRHPVFVAAVWAILVWLTYRRCKATKTHGNKAV